MGTLTHKFTGHGGRPRDPSAEDRIAKAACELLLEHGVDGTTVDAVAERAGVGKATVYRRWESKADMALAAFGCLVDGEIPPVDTGSLVGDLTEIYTFLIEFARTHEGASLLRLMAAESARDPRVAKIYRCALAQRFESCAYMFDAAVRRGELHANADRQMIFDWPMGVILTRILMERELPDKDDAARMARATANGLAQLPM
jgi:AcrR family transcriptional regulator